jgi:hypothetical protein
MCSTDKAAAPTSSGAQKRQPLVAPEKSIFELTFSTKSSVFGTPNLQFPGAQIQSFADVCEEGFSEQIRTQVISA